MVLHDKHMRKHFKDILLILKRHTERYSKGTVHHMVQYIFEDLSARGLNAPPYVISLT